MYKLLFADDEALIRNTVRDYFNANGFEVTLASNGEAAVLYSAAQEFDIIILDVMMPVKDGIEACREIRKHAKTPVLFLSALGEEADYLKGFSSGADDYIQKPFPLSVLLEKCRSLIRRASGANGDDIITAGALTLDCGAMKASINTTEIALTAKDFDILRYLVEKRGIVLSRELILSRGWGYDFEGTDRVVDTHIKNIRKALGDYSYYIKTVSGAGYVFDITAGEGYAQ